jgi:hypothetical protein
MYWAEFLLTIFGFLSKKVGRKMKLANEKGRRKRGEGEEFFLSNDFYGYGMTVLFGRWTFHIEVFHQLQKGQEKLGKGKKRSFFGMKKHWEMGTIRRLYHYSIHYQIIIVRL